MQTPGSQPHTIDHHCGERWRNHDRGGCVGAARDAERADCVRAARQRDQRRTRPDDYGAPLGIVSERELIGRTELEREARRDW